MIRPDLMPAFSAAPPPEVSPEPVAEDTQLEFVAGPDPDGGEVDAAEARGLAGIAGRR